MFEPESGSLCWLSSIRLVWSAGWVLFVGLYARCTNRFRSNFDVVWIGIFRVAWEMGELERGRGDIGSNRNCV